MVVDKSNGKGWNYLVTLYSDNVYHVYFATYTEADIFCKAERKKGHEANLYDLGKGCAL